MAAPVTSWRTAHVRRNDNCVGVDADALSEWMGKGSEVKDHFFSSESPLSVSTHVLRLTRSGSTKYETPSTWTKDVVQSLAVLTYACQQVWMYMHIIVYTIAESLSISKLYSPQD